jgi:hypothetical protein
MQSLYVVGVWMVQVGAIITLIESIALFLLFRNDEWLIVRKNRMILGIDIITGLGFIILALVYLEGPIFFTLTASFVGFLLLIVMAFSHLWRLNQYLYKPGDKFIKNTSMLVMNIIKIVMLMGGALLASGTAVVFLA